MGLTLLMAELEKTNFNDHLLIFSFYEVISSRIKPFKSMETELKPLQGVNCFNKRFCWIRHPYINSAFGKQSTLSNLMRTKYLMQQHFCVLANPILYFGVFPIQNCFPHVGNVK